MAPQPTRAFLENLRASGLLSEAQIDEVGEWTAGATGDERALADELVAKGWLTPYQAEHILAGRTRGFFIGQYVLVDRIGAGGMGRVYKAVHRQMERTVALKVLTRSRRTDPQAQARFLREARASAQLNHPNIVRAYDVGEEAELIYLVMEYVEGTDVLRVIKEQGKLDPRRAAAIARQVARALEHAREQGIVRRDIKPSNILLDEHDTPKVLDMGLARIEHTGAEVDPSTTLTRDGVLMGTVDYLAPEQAMASHSVDTRADVYSLGCTLYHILTGRVPFPASTVAQKLMKHQTREPEPVCRLVPDVPADLGAIVARMMAKRPDSNSPPAT